MHFEDDKALCQARRQYPADIQRLQDCLDQKNLSFTQDQIIAAWLRYSRTMHIASSPAVEHDDDVHEVRDAWQPLPEDDAKVLRILRKQLGDPKKPGYYVTYFICFVAVGLLLAWGSQFLFLDEALKRLASRLSSPTIGAMFYPAADEVRQQPGVSVFVIDDEDLKSLKQTYPLPYAFHARTLESMRILSPKAVFIDIWFHDERDDPSIGELVAAICRLHEDGTRVYLASMSEDGSGAPTLRSELRAISTSNADNFNKAAACATAVTVDKDVDAIDRQSWRYDLVNGTSDARVFSAAAQIYNDLSGQPPFSITDAPLALIWGVKGAEINRRPPGFKENEHNGCRNEWHKVEAIPLPRAFKERVFSSKDLDKPYCAYHPTLPIRAFHKLPGEQIQPWIEDRIIVYGGNLQSMDDVLYSPVHGRLAGLHMHAMAIDNLFHFKKDYPQVQEFDLAHLRSAGTLFPLIVVTTLALLATIIQWGSRPWSVSDLRGKCRGWWDHRQESARKRIPFGTTLSYLGLSALILWTGSWLLRGLIALAMLFLMAWLGLKIFHLGPLSWMEYAISPIAMEFLHIGKKTANYMHPKLCDFGSWFKTSFKSISRSLSTSKGST